jgi:hypothetical protein
MAKITNISIEKLIPCEDNPREILDEYSLVPSLRENGIQVPLLVMPIGDGNFRVAKGHRRLAAAKRIQTGSPEAFNAKFKQGLPCEVMSKDTSPVDFALALADHGESRTLSTDWELYMLCRLLTKAGLKREDVVKKMATVLNVAKPSRDADTIAKLNELLKIVEDAGDSPNRDSIRAEMEYEELCVKQHTSIIQRFQSIAKLPKIAEAAFQYTCTGVVPDGYTEEELPKLKGDKYKPLYSKKDGYLKDVENDMAEEHPLFNARFREMLEEQNTAKTGTTRKARSRKEVSKLRDGMESGIAKQILGFACNEPEHNEAQVRILDEKLQMLEWLEQEEPAEFKALAKRFAEWATAKAEALSE